MLTAWDGLSAALVEEAGADVVLVGDSLAMVVLGHATTLPVTLEQMLHHSQAVCRGLSKPLAQQPLVVCDLPFLSYQCGLDRAVAAVRAGLVRDRRGDHHHVVVGISAAGSPQPGPEHEDTQHAPQLQRSERPLSPIQMTGDPLPPPRDVHARVPRSDTTVGTLTHACPLPHSLSLPPPSASVEPAYSQAAIPL